MTVINLTDYKTAKNITDSVADAQLTAIIDMVNGFIEDFCHRVFGVGNFTERNEGISDHDGKFVFHVTNPPIADISSVSIKFFGTQTPLTVDVSRLDIFSNPGYAYYSYVLDPSIGVIREEYRNRFYYDITYSGGQAAPGAVKLAAIMAVSDMFESLNSAPVVSGQVGGELKSVTIGDYKEDYDTGNSVFKKMHSPETGVILTKTVQDLLRPYVYHGQSW